MARLSKQRPRNGTPSRSQAEQIDRELASKAIQKRQAGQNPTAAELSALRRWERAEEEKRRWQIYESIPQKHWREMSGRQTKVINEQAARYGIPFGGRVINLPEVVRSLHEFLAKNAHRLASGDDQSAGRDNPATIRYRTAAADLLELDLAERKKTLLPRSEVREMLALVANILRGAGDTLQRGFGPEAHAVLEEALDDAEFEIRRYFGIAQEKTDSQTTEE